MNLTPEQRAIGKDNFHAAIGSEETRRDFLQKALLAGVVSGGGLGAFYYAYGKAVDRPVRVGVIGTGDEGGVLIGAINPQFVQVTAIADLRPYNVHRALHGDVICSEMAMKARPGLMQKYGWKTEAEARKHVKVYGDYRELLANEKDIEAVIIALPLHLHAPAAIAAMKAGKHVLTEKLMGHSVHECKEMARTAEQRGLLLATGHQRHYNILYDNAMDTIRRGLLGDLHYIRAQWHRGNLPGKDSWSPALPPGAKAGDKSGEKLAKELENWKRELAGLKDMAEAEKLRKRIAQREAQIADEILNKTASKHGYEDRMLKDADGKEVLRPAVEELIRWRLWDRTGAGLMAELGSHQLDAASIFISAMHDGKKQLPLNVAAAANRPIFPADRDIEDHVYCIIEFPGKGYDPKDPIAKQKKIAVTYSSINGNGFGGYGEVVMGTKGTLILDKEQEVMLYKDADVDTRVGVAKGPVLDTQASGSASQAAALGATATANVSRGYTEQIEHFAWCIRNPAPDHLPHCHPKVAMADAIIALVTNVAARQGTRVEFKPEWFDIQSDETPENVKPDLSRYA